MQDLRLIGVHEDGQHLLLTDAGGGRYRLTLDDALRAAARRDRPRLGQLQIEIEGGLRPREVQALVRRGLSTEEVADRAGWTVEKVRRFEGPVLAEREHVAARAQQCAVGSRGNAPITLAERVGERLRDRGVDRSAVSWDSARDEEGAWFLTLTFPAGGRERTATWRYEPLGGSVTASDDEARWLSEETAPGVIPTPHQAHVGDLDVYDVEADGGLARGTVREPGEPIDLMAAMREHSARGRRPRRRPSQGQGEHRPPPDALPIAELTPSSSGVSAPMDEGPSGDEQDASGETVQRPPAWNAEEEHHQHRMPRGEVSDSGRGSAEQRTPDTRGSAPAGVDRATGEGPRRPASPRRGRPSVPSWDDIVFGTRGDEPV